MKPIARAALPLLAVLTGCAGGTFNNPITTPTPQNVTGNWQIQSGASGASGSTALGVLLLGDLVSSGTSVTGTFRFSDLAQGNGCGALNQVIPVTGTIDASNSLNLTSAPFNGSVVKVQLQVPALLQGFGVGTIQVTGSSCTFPASAAIGSLFPPATGTYTGTLTPTAGSSATTSAAATLTLTQATAPSADGQFAETGTLSLVSGGCTTSAAITGTASGVAITVSATPSPTNLTLATVLATQPAPGTAQNLMTQLAVYSTTCNGAASLPAQYSGTLNKQ